MTSSAEGTPHSSWGILKSPEKVNKLKEQDTSPAGKNDTLRCSRVSFRLENEAFGGDHREEREIETQADREVEAITGNGGESPGVDDEVSIKKLYQEGFSAWQDYVIYFCNSIFFSEEKMSRCQNYHQLKLTAKKALPVLSDPVHLNRPLNPHLQVETKTVVYVLP